MKSGIKGILFAFLGTLAIYSLVKTGVSEKIPKLRLLSSRTVDEIREDMCSSTSELENFYKEQGPEYEFSSSEGSDLLITIIKNFVKSSSSNQEIGKSEVKDYFKENAGYICILILFIILCILWIPYIFMICFKRCLCCCPNSCQNCPKFLLIGGIVLCGCAAINCFIGYTENGKIVDGVYGLGCSVLKVEQHLLYGDEYTSKKPYWAGLNTIKIKLEETRDNITELKIITNDLKISTDNLINSFESNLESEYEERKEQKVENPNPYAQTKEIIPKILESYGPPNKGDTALGLINSELSWLKEFYNKGLEKIYETIDNVNENYIEDMNKIIDDLDKNIKKTNKTISNRITEYDDTLDDINSHAKRYINTFFSINLIIVIIIGVSLVLLLMCKKGTMILCISWLFLYILMLLTFFLGAVFGLIGSFMQDASYGGSYLTKNLNEIDTLDSQALDIAEVCLNGNGSLANSELIPSEFDLAKVDDVFALENTINGSFEILENYTPNSTEENKKIYESIMTSKDKLVEINEALNEVRKYIDISVKDSETTSTIRDEWQINETDCTYPIKRKNNLRNLLEEDESERCFIISEWTEEEIENIYTGKDHYQTIIDYYKSITGYLDSARELVSQIIIKNNEFNASFYHIKQEGINGLENIKNSIVPLKETYNEIAGEDNSIFEILNCKFLKRDVNKILVEMHDSFGGTFKNTSTLLLLISAFELGMTIFILAIVKSNEREKSS